VFELTGIWTAILLAALCASALAWVAALLHERGVNPLRRLFRKGAGEAFSAPVAVVATAAGHCDLTFGYWTTVGGALAEDAAVQRITAVDPPLMADITRDGAIDAADVAACVAGRVFRYWINEDTDKGDYVGHISGSVPNASDLVVNGRLDLVNLFPVKLDLKPFIDAWGSAATFKISAPDGSFNFCGVDVAPSAAGTIQTNDVYTTTGDPLYAADLTEVEYEGVDITPSDYLGNNNEPGVLAFESLVAGRQLTLAVFFGDMMVLQFPLPAHFSSVRDMYRWYNGRHFSGQSEGRSSMLGEPSNNPFGLENVKTLVFLHGANVSEADAEKWGDTLFKRLWLAGFKANFINVDWRGDIGSKANYHQNASNAFEVATQLAPVLSALPGEKVIMAHSLGNMVVSSMIQDHRLQVSKYIMCNSAVPAEAYDASVSLRVPQLVHPDWEEYPTVSWAATWYTLFANDPDDDRKFLGWPGRFSNVAQYAVNFYSTGDEVLELASNNNLWPGTGVWGDNTWGHLSWHKQELFKGSGIGVGGGATDWSGWNIEENMLGVNKISVQDALQMGAEDFKTNTVFYCYLSSMNSTNIPLLVRGAHLAQGIPALTPAAGRVAFGGAGMEQRSINCDDTSHISRPNVWPNLSDYPGHWRHSDMKDIAYFFNFKFYEKIIEKGNLE